MLMILVPILCFSKSYFLVFFPISILVFIVFWKKISKRQKIYLFVLGLSSLIQLIYMNFNKSGWNYYSVPSEKSLNYIDKINNMFYTISQNLIYLISPNITLSSNILSTNFIFLIIFILGVIIAIYYLYKYKNKESLILVIFIIIIFGSALLNAVSGILNDQISWTNTIGINEDRHSFFILISMIFFGILLIYNYLKKEENEKERSKKYVFIGLLLFIRFFLFDNPLLPNLEESYSDWNVYSRFYNESEYLIPLEPSPWYTSKNVDLHYIGYRQDNPLFRNDNKLKKVYLNPYVIKQIHEINFDTPVYLTHLYLTRLRADNYNKLKIRGYDNNGNIVIELDQLNDKKRKNVGFRNYKRVKISKIKIFTEDSQEAYVFPTILYGTALK
jgi:hypothetical protein